MKKLFKILTFAFVTLMFNQSAMAAIEHGTSDEAVALVKKAAAFMTANGKEKSLAEFNKPISPFIHKDLYIFIMDMKGTVIAHGANPKLIDKNLLEMKDMDGVLFAKNFIDVGTTKGTGWVDYKWPNPVTKAMEQKSTYIMKVGDLLVGCGIYK